MENGWWPTEDFRFSDLLLGADIPVLVDAWVELGHIVPQELRGKAIDYLEFPDEPMAMFHVKQARKGPGIIAWPRGS